MLKFAFLLLAFIVVNTVSFASYELIQKTIDGKKVNIIKVVLDGTSQVITSISNKGEPLDVLVEKVGGIAGINGAYFCPKDYDNCGGIDYTNAPRFYEGKNYSKYENDFGVNGVFAFDDTGKPFIVMNQVWGEVPEKLQGLKINVDKISKIKYGLGNFPVLLLSGKNMVSLYDKLLSYKMKAKNTKNFICYTPDKKLVYMGNVSNITIYELPDFIKNNFNCYGAINLDAGASLGMVYKNKYIIKNSRPVMDAFVVVDKNFIVKKQKILKKYNKVINLVVKKLQKIKKDNLSKYLAIISKLKFILNKYSNNFEINVVISYILSKLNEI